MSDNITAAAEDLARQVAGSLAGLTTNLPADEQVYVYALVVPDDFSSLMGCANTEKHFGKSKRKPLDRWYFAEWMSGGMDVDTGPMEQLIGRASDEDINGDGPHTIQASWLVAMSEALRKLRNSGRLVFRNQPINAFCSIIDCRAATWIEMESARHVLSPESFAKVQPEMRAAAAAWYGEDDPAESSQAGLRKEFEKLHASRKKLG